MHDWPYHLSKVKFFRVSRSNELGNVKGDGAEVLARPNAHVAPIFRPGQVIAHGSDACERFGWHA